MLDAADFDIDSDDAVAARIHGTGLSVLRHDLSQRLQQLKGELVELINTDYAAFIGLATALKAYAPLPQNDGDDAENPLDALDALLAAARADAAAMAAESRALLERRLALRRSLARAQTRRAVAESLAALEARLASLAAASESHADMQRAVAEMHRLRFLAAGDSSAGDSSKTRIDAAAAALARLLGGATNAALQNVLANKPGAQEDLKNCLRNQALVDRGLDAAGLELRALILPDIDKLAQSHSHDLDAFYAAVLEYIRDSLSVLLHVSRSVFSSSSTTTTASAASTTTPPSSSSTATATTFDFLVDVVLPIIWDYFLVPTRAFYSCSSPGIPDSFHCNYLSSTRFVESLEKSFLQNPHGSKNEDEEHSFTTDTVDTVLLSHFRSHPSTLLFWKRWNLEVYFKIRQKDLVSAYETCFESNILMIRVLDSKSGTSIDGFQLAPTSALLTTLRKIWEKEDIYLAPLIAAFYKFSLQCLNRYLVWCSELAVSLNQKLKELNEPIPAAVTTTSQISDTATSPTAAPPDTETQENSILTVVAALLGDIGRLPVVLTSLFDDCISEKLPLGFPDSGALKEQLLQTVKTLKDTVVTEYQSKCAAVLIKRCCGALDEVSVVVQRTGFSSNLATTASAYVFKILSPATEFFTRLSAAPEQGTGLKDWKLLVCEGVSAKYHAIVAQQLEDLAKLDRYRNRKKATVAEGAVTAFDKIKRQMAMDVEQYRIETASFLGDAGVAVASLALLEGLVK
ncbi:hypothetical protein BDR26DRAFT_1008246 [Obelidium mucronatum]|nr:hypothetical protein BDR26DRAFT_1008246 [Obelidium mucronatum]